MLFCFIDILYCLVEHLDLTNIVNNKIILIKRNYLTIRKVAYTLYQK